MSAFANYVSSDSEEDEEYEKQSAESNRKAKLEMERKKAKKNLERKREELKQARLQREEQSRHRKEREQEVLLANGGSSNSKEELAEGAELDILQALASAYLGGDGADFVDEADDSNEQAEWSQQWEQAGGELLVGDQVDRINYEDNHVDVGGSAEVQITEVATSEDIPIEICNIDIDFTDNISRDN